MSGDDGTHPLRLVAYGVVVSRITQQDRVEAQRRLLVGLARNEDVAQIVRDVADLHVRHNTFPGEEFMLVAADGLELARATRADPIPYEGLLSTHLPEIEIRGKDRPRVQYTVLTTFALHGGLQPDLLDEVAYWIDRYWEFALFATVAIIRACAERAEQPVSSFATDLAARRSIKLSAE